MLLNEIIVIESDNRSGLDISFENGLNIVNGKDDCYDIFGVIDFALGGDCVIYQNKKSYKQAEIRMRFNFYGETKRFKRFYPDKKYIFSCDANYEIEERYTVKRYMKYILGNNGVHNRELSDKSIREYFVDTEKMFSLYKSIAIKEYNRDYLKIIGEYYQIKMIDDKKNDVESKLKIFDSACACNFIKSAHSEKELKNNKKRICELNIQQEIISKKVKQSSINDKLVHSVDEMFRMEKYSDLEMERISIESQIRTIESSENPYREDFIETFETLQHFFPSANLELLNNIESFHDRLKHILSSEFEEKKRELERKLIENNKLIDQIKKKSLMDESDNESMLRMRDNYMTMHELEEQNNNYEVRKYILHKIEVLEDELNDLKEEKFNYGIHVIDEERYRILDNINRLLDKEQSKYLRETMRPNDNGCLDKGNIYFFIFMLALMNITMFPFMIYDKKVWDNIDDKVRNVVQNYLKGNDKQIIVA